MKTTKSPGRYACVLLDYWFKRTFGMEGRQRLLMLFLQEVIPEHKIASLTYAPQEHENPHPDRKGIRVDVECTDEDGTRFVVEMQLARQKHFYERALFNSTFAIQEQMEVGRDTYDFPAVYFIGLMDFTLHEGSEKVIFSIGNATLSTPASMNLISVCLGTSALGYGSQHRRAFPGLRVFTGTVKEKRTLILFGRARYGFSGTPMSPVRIHSRFAAAEYVPGTSALSSSRLRTSSLMAGIVTASISS